jgi:hypothetical protein
MGQVHPWPFLFSFFSSFFSDHITSQSVSQSVSQSGVRAVPPSLMDGQVKLLHGTGSQDRT